MPHCFEGISVPHEYLGKMVRSSDLLCRTGDEGCIKKGWVHKYAVSDSQE
jgi:hypothetical protein